MGSCCDGQRNKPNESVKPQATYESFLNFVEKQTREGTIDTRYKWAENEGGVDIVRLQASIDSVDEMMVSVKDWTEEDIIKVVV